MLDLLLLPFKLVWYLLRFILRLVTSIFWFVLVVTLLIVTLNTVAPQNSLTQSLNAHLRQASTYFSNEEVGQGLTQLVTDKHTVSQSGARWQTANATVYIDTADEVLRTAYQSAIENWNATGAFTFTMVDSKDKADIIATDYADSKTQAAGVAESMTNPLTYRFIHVDVKLNTYYLFNETYGYTLDRIIHTAEHELGHAIGLDHEDSETSVMVSSGSYDGIQARDIAAVNAIYQD